MSDMLPAIPPEDYSGSQTDWLVGLQQMGRWNGEGWHGDVLITSDEWWELLKQCEGDE